MPVRVEATGQHWKFSTITPHVRDSVSLSLGVFDWAGLTGPCTSGSLLSQLASCWVYRCFPLSLALVWGQEGHTQLLLLVQQALD